MTNRIFYFHQYLDCSGGFSIDSVDNYSVTNYDGSPRTRPGLSVTTVAPNSWLHFKTSIPPGEFTSNMIFSSTQKSNQRIQIRLGHPDGEILWTFTSKTTSKPGIFTDSTSGQIASDYDREQDIYFCFPNGFSGALNWFCFCQSFQQETDEAAIRRMQWFNESRFGHMMHWGAYSVLGKGEWIMDTDNIPKEQYIQEACIPFNPTQYDPEAWADTIYNAGQRYLTITTKHHDGFAMFETNVDDFAPYDVENTANIHHPVLTDLAAACRRRGIKFATYYSLLDWGNVHEVAVEDAAAADPRNPNPAPLNAEWYISELKEHLKELIEIFDPVLIWFDGGWAHFLNDDVANNINRYLRQLSPEIIINNRLSGNPNVADYTTPEQSIPPGTLSGPWESCMTMNNSWGYNRSDLNWKSTLELLQHLLDCASKGGNYLLNTGPTGDGLIPQPCIDRLSKIGMWLNKWGTAVYGTRAGTLDVSAQSGAYCTMKLPGTVYITLTEWPEDKKVRIDRPVNTINRAYWLDRPNDDVTWQIVDGLVCVDLPEQSTDSLGVVLVMELNGYPEPKIYPDLALFSHATASNTWYRNTVNNGPQCAVDGNRNTRWATDQGASFPITFEVAFDKEKSFNRVAFSQHEARINDFIIEANVSGKWKTIISGASPSTDYINYLSQVVTATKVRLVINSVNEHMNPSLYSFSLYNTADLYEPITLPVNIARGSSAQANNVWYNKAQYQPSMAIDGSLSTRWAANDNPVLPILFTLNFIKPETFDTVSIAEYIDTATNAGRISRFTLQILASDEVTWVDIYQGTDTSLTITLPRRTQSTALRLVISQLHGTQGPSIYELNVWQTVRLPLIKLGHDDLLEAEARLSFEYFWREANTTEGALGYGLISSSMGSRTSSIAHSGFALSGLVIAVERGWISQSAAQERCEKSLYTLKNNLLTHNGFFQHFINMDNPTDPTNTTEYSTVDTMLALNGILTAGQYFGGKSAILAQQIFDRVDWYSAIAPNGHFTMAWDNTGVMSSATWGGYAEQFCMYPMAAGSTTLEPANGADMFYSLERKHGRYGNCGELIYVWGGELFTYQFSPAWIDFRKVIDRKGDDWWQNSVNASLSNLQFCIDNSDIFPSMGNNDWGLTASDAPSGYGVYGSPPSGNLNANGSSVNNMHRTDGTITPSGPIGSLPFMPDPNVVFSAMQHWYQDHPRLWTGYGFLESYNLSMPMPWYSSSISGLIKGITLLMIENYRSGLIWNIYMQHPVIKKGLAAIFDLPKK
ncbi:alpha-L-fucosidase [Budvicia diplopodorum]|uniref:alpha-L-fucosidase n=1 Tax=Budvicia diplopodorum TaxID=1119056 RepID=UPI00135B715C|nr:alpha-L-fucosidase [Budvicia diplopodorum]